MISTTNDESHCNVFLKINLILWKFAAKFLKKSILIYIKKSTNIVQAHSCSFIRSEMVGKMVEAIIFQISEKRATNFLFSF